MEHNPFLFIFLDGVGIGPADGRINPFLAADLPNLRLLLEGGTLDSTLKPFQGTAASFQPADATLGVEGNPESATGQCTLLTGKNIPAMIGSHYGPKPDRKIHSLLEKYNLIHKLVRAGLRVRLLNAYPDAYFEAVQSGRRLHAAIPLAFVLAGIPLATTDDLVKGDAISADFTGRGWRTRLHQTQTPVLTPREAGVRVAELATRCDLTVIDHWPTDYAGHYGDMQGAVRLLEVLDQMIGGLVDAMQGTTLCVAITSDHGNMEDLSVRGHTRNPVPFLCLGPFETRRRITRRMADLTGLAPAILDYFGQAPGK
jgi:2,3-bisphosphoglycerate-independent phosphoglycerate mutase